MARQKSETAQPGPVPANDGTGAESKTIRVPADIHQMIKLLASYAFRGWAAQDDITNDPSCPLRAWLEARQAELMVQIAAQQIARRKS